jgi:hypothetical protein
MTARWGAVDERAQPERGRSVTSPAEGVRPELLVALVLRRALRGGVAQAGPIYVDYGYRMGRYLIGTFRELIEDGLLSLAEENCRPAASLGYRSGTRSV